MMAKMTPPSIDEFYELLAGTKPLSQFTAAELFVLVERYPYFETAYKIYLKRLLQEDEEAFYKALEQATPFLNMNEVFWEFLFIEDLDTKNRDISPDPIPSAVEENAESVSDRSADKASTEEAAVEDGNPLPETLPVMDKNTGEQEREDDKTDELPEPARTSEEKGKPNPKHFKRKIKEGYEHMGENLAATISNQMDLAKPKADEKIRYSPDLYFIDQDDNGEEPLTLADIKRLSATPFKQRHTTNGFLEIDESEKVEQAPAAKMKAKSKNEQDLLDLDDAVATPKASNRNTEAFDIREYSDEEVEEEEEDLISRFIKSNPRLEPADLEEEKEKPQYVEELAEKSVSEDKGLVSEPLIEVFIKQGYYEKAIDAFQQLSLNNPEKSAYFARRIKNLREIIKKHKK
ncbi:MAG: hypothetical protein ACQESW_01475 [Bacteroidota bacterium]